MLTAFIIWLIGVSGNISLLLLLSGLTFMVSLGTVCFYRGVEDHDVVWDKTCKTMLISGMTLLLLATTIPSEKTAYLMVAGYIAQETITSDTGQKLVQVVNIELDKIIKEGLKNGN